MQGQQLEAKQVVARLDALQDVEVDPSLVRDHVIDPPDSGRGVERILPDLEPLQPL